MSIKTQKILCFIPVVNIITMFCWLVSCSVNSVSPVHFLKNLIKAFGLMAIITAIRIAVSLIFQNTMADIIVLCISLYFYFLSMAWVAIKAQEEILKSNENNSK